MYLWKGSVTFTLTFPRMWRCVLLTKVKEEDAAAIRHDAGGDQDGDEDGEIIGDCSYSGYSHSQGLVVLLHNTHSFSSARCSFAFVSHPLV